jgi:hypothetical protein
VKTSRWNQSQQIYYWPNADHALTGRVRSFTKGRLATGMLHWSDAQPSLVTCDWTRLVALEPLWNLSRVDRTLQLACPITPLSLCLVITEHAALVNSNAYASGHLAPSVSSHYVDARCCRATYRTHAILVKGTSGDLCRSYFFMILCPAWFPSLCLDFAWYHGSSLVLL